MRKGFDDPIESKCDDVLQRDPFVATVYHVLEDGCDPMCCSARYLGVSGAWGEGKSSVYRLLRQHDKEWCHEHGEAVSRFLFVEFNGWEVKKNFAERLFACIVDHVPAIEAADGADDFVAQMRYWSVCLDQGKRLNCFLRCLGCCDLSALLRAMKMTLPDLKDAIAKFLRNLKTHIVVVIDDVDRMLPDEVFDLLRVVRANGDLPNLTYLVLADKMHLAELIGIALSGRLDSQSQRIGLEYLQKVLPFFMPLPKAVRSKLEEYFNLKISKIVKKRFGDNAREYSSKSKPVQFALSILTTMRDIKQVVVDFDEALYHFIDAFEDVGTPGVEINDLVALLALRHVRPELYEVLYLGCVHAQGRQMPQTREGIFTFYGLDVRPSSDADVFWEFLTACDFFRQDTETALKEHLKNKDMDSQVKWIYQGDELENIARFRLCSRASFAHYFTGRADHSGLCRSDFEKADDSAAIGAEAVAQHLMGLDLHDRLQNFVMYYPRWMKSPVTEIVKNLLSALATVADKDLKHIGPHESLYDSIYLAFRQLVFEKIENFDERETAVLSVFENDRSSIYILSCLMDDLAENGGCRFRNSTCNALAKLLLQRMWAKWPIEDYRLHPRGSQMYAHWVSIALSLDSFLKGDKNTQGFDEYFKRMVASPDSYADALVEPLVHHCAGPAEGQELLALEPTGLEKFMTEQELFECFKRIEEGVHLSAPWYVVYRRLELWPDWHKHAKCTLTMVQFLNENTDVAEEWKRRLNAHEESDE